MMGTEFGRSGADAPSGHSAEPEPSSTVSAVPVSVPNAAPWWRCLHCGHDKYEEHVFIGDMRGVPMVHCADCKALHSPPDHNSHRAMIATLREVKAALQLTVLVESREDVGACIAEIISRLDHHIARAAIGGDCNE